MVLKSELSDEFSMKTPWLEMSPIRGTSTIHESNGF